MAAAKAQGKQLGRRKGSKNKERLLDQYKDQIKRYLQMGLNLASVRTIINNQLAKPITYHSFKYFVRHEADLSSIWQIRKEHTVSKFVTQAVHYNQL